MAKTSYIGINQKARKINEWYLGVNDIAKGVKHAYIGVGGIARPFMSVDKVTYYGQATSLNVARRYLAATTVGDYALFGGGNAGTSKKYTVDAYSKDLVKTTVASLSQTNR